MSEKILELILEKLEKIDTEQRGMKQGMSGINKRLENIESKQHIVYEQTGILTERHEEIMSRFNDLATKEYFDKK
ncbi:hypothetical protein [Alteribacillus sp. YIM 98480]|uniref:hypothetical protein n=1 Tax=Alteribacillus sp. YIM 98480 TaxID=2606599 RepID=UPI00131C4058|nr:hypothetical protein [Alteribacillus sp. YIM 98480]